VGLSEKFPVGSIAEGQVSSLTKFGAFVQISEGVEGMIHISEISAEKRIHHPQDVLKIGQPVRAEVLAIDPERRILRLSMKRMLPTTFDEYVSEHREGDIVTGRIVEVSGPELRVELGEGIQGNCKLRIEGTESQGKATTGAAPANADLASLTSMLRQRWKGGSSASASSPGAIRPGQIAKFRIKAIDSPAKNISLEALQA
jgi:small subunit ribosomal protein S1